MMARKIIGFMLIAVMLTLSSVIVYSAGTIALPKTGQTGCWDKNGAVVSCTGTGQDGETLTGADWPAQRFTNNGNGTITDNLTGLIWSQDAKSSTTGTTCTGGGTSKNWTNALLHITCLNTQNFKGFNDWRLPNTVELNSLYNPQESNPATWLENQGFTNMLATALSYWWTSTTYNEQPSKAWIVSWRNSKTTATPGSSDTKDGKNYYIWPVRGGN